MFTRTSEANKNVKHAIVNISKYNNQVKKTSFILLLLFFHMPTESHYIDNSIIGIVHNVRIDI